MFVCFCFTASFYCTVWKYFAVQLQQSCQKIYEYKSHQAFKKITEIYLRLNLLSQWTIIQVLTVRSLWKSFQYRSNYMKTATRWQCLLHKAPDLISCSVPSGNKKAKIRKTVAGVCSVPSGNNLRKTNIWCVFFAWHPNIMILQHLTDVVTTMVILSGILENRVLVIRLSVTCFIKLILFPGLVIN